MADTNTALTIDDLCAEILQRRDRHYESESFTSIQHCPRASNIGECDRELVYQMTHWQHRPKFPPSLLQRFQRGHDVEAAVKRDMSQIGMEVIESQLTCEVRDRDNTLLSTAHVDGRVQWHTLTPVFECKSLNPNVWGRVNSVEDFKQWTWSKRYPRQLLLYMYARSEPHGILVADDCCGHWKVFPYVLEDRLDECELLLRRLRTAVDAKASGGLPPFIDNPLVCRDCWAFQAGICAPPMDWSGSGVHVFDDDELVRHLDGHREHAASGVAYGKAEKAIKENFKARGQGEYLVGQYHAVVNVTRAGTRTRWEYLGNPPAPEGETGDDTGDVDIFGNKIGE